MPIPLILQPALRGEPRVWDDLSGKPSMFPSNIASVTGLQAALDAKIPLAQKAAANGVATLDSSGKVPVAQLPADQGVEFAGTFSQLPAPGVQGKLYATQDAKRIYIWDAGLGQYVMSPHTTDDIEEGSVNKWFAGARVLATVLAGFSVGTATAITASDTVLQAFGKAQAQLDTAILSSNIYYDPGWIGSLDSTKLTVGTGLPSNIVTSALTRVGTINTGVWQGTAIADTYLQTISAGGKVANSATTATSANTASAIVARDGSGDFHAGVVTASFVGNLTGLASSSPANALTGNTLAAGVVNSSLQTFGTVSAGTWAATPVADAYIGVLSATGKVLNSATTGTPYDSASTLVLRDSLGNFAASAVALDTLAVTTSATVGGSGVVTLAAAQVLTNKTIDYAALNGTPTGSGVATGNTASTLVLRDGAGGFSAGDITANLVGNASTASAVAVANVTGLLSGGKILSSLLPSIAITDTYVVASQAAMLALGGATPPAEHGDVAVRTDINKTFILAGTNPAVLGDWQELLTPTDAVLSVAGRTGNITLISSDITDATSTATAGRLVLRDGSGNFAAGTITAALAGNATTATALQTARTINGTSFDGSANVTVTANAQTLTGTFVNTSVVTGSFNTLTPVSGTLTISGAQSISSTLSVTSTIGAGGAISTTATGASLTSSGASTSQRYALLGNSGGDAYYGIESSVGGAIIASSTPYDAAIRAPSGLSVSANNGASVQLRLSSAGALTMGGVFRNDLPGNGTSAIITGGGSNLQVKHDSGAILYLFNSAGGGIAVQNALANTNVFTLDNAGNTAIGGTFAGTSATFSSNATSLGKSVTTGQIALAGGTSVSVDGASVQLFGSTNATDPNKAYLNAVDFTFRSMNGGVTYSTQTSALLTINTAQTVTGLLTANGGISGALAGNADTATKLATARAINGVNFDGSAGITVTAAAGTLSGNTLAAGVTASSLTSVGAIGTGVWQGTAIANAYIASGLDVTKLTAGTTLPGNVLASSLTSTGILTALQVGAGALFGYNFEAHAETTGGNALFVSGTQGGDNIGVWTKATSGNSTFISFYTEGTPTSRGSISYNRAGGLTAYNVTSDYRSKDVLGEITNSGELIDALHPVHARMRGATMDITAFVAHELAAVLPYAVTGEKDGELFQQVNLMALVPLHTAELQSLRSRVARLEA